MEPIAFRLSGEQKHLETSHDSDVFIVKNTTLFPNPTQFATPGLVVIQDLSPLESRTSREDTLRAAQWNSIITDRAHELGVLNISHDPSSSKSAVKALVVENKVVTLPDGKLAIVSPFIPGPRLDEIMQSQPTNRNILECWLIELELLLRNTANSEIIHLDPRNVKYLKFDEQTFLVVTDIQSRIGEGVIEL